MSNLVDWNSVADQKASGKKKNDDLVFLGAKNLPQTFLPGPKAVVYESFYDDATKKNRPPQPGDDTSKVRTQYMFHALYLNEKEPDKTKNKTVKICVCGQQVAEGIGTVQKTLNAMDCTGFVKVSATGTGLTTKYAVEFVKVGEKPIPLTIWDKLAAEVEKLPGLEEMRDRLLGIKAPVAETGDALDSGAVSEVNKNNELEI